VLCAYIYWTVGQLKLLYELNAEMEDVGAIVLRPPPLAPRALLKAGKRGVVLAPLSHDLLKVPGARLMHPKRSEWLNR